jgi:hypothetical protein
MNLCFWTTEEAGPYLNRARAKHESSRNATPIGNPSCCNGRKTYGVHNGRQQREEAGLLAFRIVCHKTAPMSASLGTLRDDDIRTGNLGRLRLCNCRDRGKPEDVSLLELRHEV